MRSAFTSLTTCVLLLTLTSQASAQRLDDVIARLGTYAREYGERFANLVAVEDYRQQSSGPGASGPESIVTRQLRSDYALTMVAGLGTWLGLRDTFEVDGQPVRSRVDRLTTLLHGNTGGGLAEARRITADNARFNLAADTIVRNVNVPTVVLELMHPRHRWRFTFSKEGEEALDGVNTWRIRFRERETPTLIRRESGANQPVRGTVWVEPMSGDVRRTHLTWSSGPVGSITVSFGAVPTIDGLVPLRMTERYEAGQIVVTGDAVYAGFRRFETSGRLASPP